MHRRRIVWADTDPAGIAYTGRFSYFALEAIEAWCAARLGVTWFGSYQDGAIMPFVRAELDFRAPLRPDDELLTTVLLERVGGSSVVTRVMGRRADGTLSFEGRFVQVFAGTDLGKRPVPETFHPAVARELAIAAALQGV